MKNPVKRLTNKVVPKKIGQKVNRQKLVLRKNAPHIAFVAGVAGVGVSTVLACRATLKLHETLDVIERDLEVVRDLKKAAATGNSENYPVEQIGRDTTYVYAKSAYKLGRLYGPSVAVGLGSVALLTHSHVNLTRRNGALVAAYAATLKAYDDYRERVIAELGEDKELDLHHAKVDTQVTAHGGDVAIVDPNQWSPYARFFDEVSPQWEKNAELNRLFVQCVQNYANEKLRAQGHLFLNEVYDMLGLERSQAGSVVGWVIGKGGDDFVDFGMYEAASSRFINGWERSILLDFNVDGVIYNLI